MVGVGGHVFHVHDVYRVTCILSSPCGSEVRSRALYRCSAGDVFDSGLFPYFSQLAVWTRLPPQSQIWMSKPLRREPRPWAVFATYTRTVPSLRSETSCPQRYDPAESTPLVEVYPPQYPPLDIGELPGRKCHESNAPSQQDVCLAVLTQCAPLQMSDESACVVAGACMHEIRVSLRSCETVLAQPKEASVKRLSLQDGGVTSWRIGS